jgi:peptidoglycan hydrolase-like amidase
MRRRTLVAPRPAPLWRTLPALAGLLSTFAVGLVAAAPPAAAEEVLERPASGVWAVEGRGWGHGRGMSQWGAQGAASQGVSAEQIVSTYYPGTARAVLPAAPIRVLLSGDEGRDTEVVADAGLTATDLTTGASAVLPAGPARWRVVVDAAGFHLQAQTGSTWTPYALGGATTLPGPVRFGGREVVRVAYADGTSRDYRGTVRAVRASASALRTVVVLPLEDYLLGVVPRESSASWRPAALQAQAIAARSYSANKRARVAGRGTYDICDTTACQVFGGSAVYSASGARTGLEPASTTAAVRATDGVVRTSGGVPVFAEFSSSNGGWSTDGDHPYLRAARDDWDGALTPSVHAWTAVLRASDLERRFPAVGRLQRVRVIARDGNGPWGGRVRSVVLEGVSAAGTPTRVSTSGAGVYGARRWPAARDGLRSSWWRLVPADAPVAGAPQAPPTAATPAPTPPTTPAVTSALVAASRPPLLVQPPGRPSGTLTATFRNTGTTPWPATALQLVRNAPPGHPADPLAAPPTATRLVALKAGAAVVRPGETVTLALALDATRVPTGTTRARTGCASSVAPRSARRSCGRCRSAHRCRGSAGSARLAR